MSAAGKRAAEEAFVDLTQESDDDAPILPPAAKKMGAAAPAGSPRKPVIVVGVGTPAAMRSRELQARLRQFGAPESEIKGCLEKSDLVALHERYQREHSLRGAPSLGLDTPPTISANRPRPGSAKPEPSASSASAAYLSSMHAAPAGGGAAALARPGGIVPAIPYRASQATAKNIAGRHLAGLQAEQDRLERAAAERRRASLAAVQAATQALARSFSSSRSRTKCSLCGRKPNRCYCAGLGARGGRGGGMGGGSASGGLPPGLGADVPSRAEEEQDQEVRHPASAAARSAACAPHLCAFPTPCAPAWPSWCAVGGGT